MNYDIIGDIHGHSDQLEILLQKLGYDLKGGVYQHQEDRQVIFLGDFIDRGPKIRQTLHIAKNMCDFGSAQAIMGNHEFNAITFHTKNKKDGGFFREHNYKEIHQYYSTLEQFKQFPDELEMFINWFRELPIFLEIDDEFRVVHACWESDSIERIEKIFPEGKFSTNKDVKYLSHKFDDTNAQLKNKALTLYNDLSKILTGIEEKLPGNLYFLDSYKHKRFEVRLKWWNLNKNNDLKDVMFNFYDIQSKENLSTLSLSNQEFQTTSSKPIFIGHYWLTGKPEVMSSSVVCIDYSIAKGGKLVAYSSGDFSKLSNNNFTM
jgi:hypothetical protein